MTILQPKQKEFWVGCFLKDCSVVPENWCPYHTIDSNPPLNFSNGLSNCWDLVTVRQSWSWVRNHQSYHSHFWPVIYKWDKKKNMSVSLKRNVTNSPQGHDLGLSQVSLNEYYDLLGWVYNHDKSNNRSWRTLVAMSLIGHQSYCQNNGSELCRAMDLLCILQWTLLLESEETAELIELWTWAI